MLRLACVLFLLWTPAISAAQFDVTQFDATPNDETDDTVAIAQAFKACAAAGGGEVYIPAGTYLISRQGAESPILEVPSNTTIRGDGAASILKFDPKVNDTNFWRMLGAGEQDCRNVVIRDLHLDGSNTYQSYEPGKTPEQNHGIFFYRKGGVVENVTIQDCLVENFSGDCIGISLGCRNFSIRNVALRNFVRQGIQMGGGDGARDYLVTGCHDLEGTVRPGGSTIHVEHARGLQNVIISDNRCRNSILAGGVDGIIIRDNTITGRLVGNGNSRAVIQGNLIRGVHDSGSVVQLGFTDGLILKDNLITAAEGTSSGIYLWGTSKYNPDPSRDFVLSGNLVRVDQGRGIFLNGVEDGIVTGNSIKTAENAQRFVMQRAERVTSDITD